MNYRYILPGGTDCHSRTRGLWQAALALAFFWVIVATPLQAEPVLDRPEPLLWSKDHLTAWQLYPDRVDAALFYRLPRIFALSMDESRQPMVFARRGANRDLMVDFYWSSNQYGASEDEFIAAFRSVYGYEARVVSPVPYTIQVEPPAEIKEQFEGDLSLGTPSVLPGELIQGTLHIPQKNEANFRRELAGLGFTGMVTMNYYFDSADRGTVRLAHTTALFMQVSQGCLLSPERPCQK